MRVAILTNPDCRSPRLLAEGLQRMLSRIGIAADCHAHALRDFAAIAVQRDSVRNQLAACRARFRNWAMRLDSYDLIVVSETIGILGRTALLASLKSLGRPILHYEVFAYAGSQYFIRQFGPTAHHWFDGFLVVSGIHDDPPLDGPPVFEIGMDLPELAPFQPVRHFSALLDFPRHGYERERQIQEDALTSLQIPFSTLQGEYTFFEIDEMYAQSAVAFVAFPEAFGVPIAQLQRHGSVIASPYPRWVKRHALQASGHVFDDTGDANQFTENFLFYRSTAELKEELAVLRANFDPRSVASRFALHQPSFIDGRLDVLREAIDTVLSNAAERSNNGGSTNPLSKHAANGNP